MSELKDGIGLTLTDMSSAMEEHPFIINYADAGFGKSTMMARCFGGATDTPGALFLTTNKQVLRPYASWCRENAEMARDLKMRTIYEWNPKWKGDKSIVESPPFLDGFGGSKAKQRAYEKGGVAVKVIPKLKPQDISSRAPNLELAYRVVEAYAKASAKGKCPYSGLIWDEGTEFFRRWAGEIEDVESWIDNVAPIKTSTSDLRKNPFARRVAMNEFIDWFTNVPRTLECFMGLVCHGADPVYFGQAKTDPPARIGDLKYRGGPQLTTGPLRAAVSAIADIVLQGVVTSTGKRVWKTQLDDVWFRKFRDFSVGPEIPSDQFHWALWRAGYGVPKPLDVNEETAQTSAQAGSGALL